MKAGWLHLGGWLASVREEGSRGITAVVLINRRSRRNIGACGASERPENSNGQRGNLGVATVAI
jgi:hypothetical protein